MSWCAGGEQPPAPRAEDLPTIRRGVQGDGQGGVRETLDLAKDLHARGMLALERGDLATAEKDQRRSLATRQRFAPGSLLVAESLNALGNVAVEQGRMAAAQDYLQRSLLIRRKLAPGSRDLALSLIGLGMLAWRRGDVAKQEYYFQQALNVGDPLLPADRAAIFDGLGNVSFRHAQPEQAREYFSRALELRQQSLPDSLAVADSWTYLGRNALGRGELAQAQDYFRQALDLRRKLAPGSVAVAASLNDLGNVSRARGDLAESEACTRQALQIRQQWVPGSLAVADSLSQLSSLFWMREDVAKAREYSEQALRIRRKLSPESLALADSLNWMGLLAGRSGDPGQAQAYFLQALRIHETLWPLSLVTAGTLTDLGGLARSRGDLAQSEDYFRRALAIQHELAPGSPGEAGVLENLANTVRQRADLAAAEKYYREALAIRERKAAGSAGHASLLFALATLARQQRQLDAAAQLFAQAIDVFENQTASLLGGTEEDRSAFRARFEGVYKNYIDLLIVQKKPELAFDVLERSRARTLLELLADARVDIRTGNDPALRRQERSLREALGAKSSYRIRLLNDAHTPEQLAALDEQLAQLRDQYESVEAQIRIASPAYAALTQPQPLGAVQVQQQLLDENTLLLEYSLGDNRSYVWAVGKTSLAVYPLSPRPLIEKAARNVHELLIARSRRVEETPRHRQRRLAQAEVRYAQAAAELSRMVLGPVAALLEHKRLLIVSDGALQYIPFAALPAPGVAVAPSGSPAPADRSNDGRGAPLVGTGTPLVMQHEIVSLPSASVLAELRRAKMLRPEPPMAVAVLADPVFDARDERVASSAARVQASAQSVVAARTSVAALAPSARQLTRSALQQWWPGRDRGTYLDRLLWTRREAAEILKVTPAGEGFEALDFRASTATALSPRLAQYRIVHFATHALSDSEHPEWSGLVLSLFNEQGEPQNGFLGLDQIYNMNLPADLVVLSACDTALGKEIRGEGLIGLARGFMYAGANSVIASLWSVDDEVTAELMGRFYKAVEQEKMSPAAALRVAQLHVQQQDGWRSPYYWAGFQIEGEWQ